MNTKPKYIIDSQNNTATLDIYVEDVLVTTYVYSNNKVTLSERISSVDVSLDILIDNITQIFEWCRLIAKIIVPENIPKNRFDEDLKKKSSEVICSFKYKGDLVTDANFQEGNDYVTFQPRDEIEMGYYDFFGWANFLLHFYDECKNFK